MWRTPGVLLERLEDGVGRVDRGIDSEAEHDRHSLSRLPPLAPAPVVQ